MDALFEVKFRGKHINALVESALFLGHSHLTVYHDKLVKFNLNTRDRLVLKLIFDGKTSDQIAQKLNLSKKSIDGIRAELLKKFGAKNLTDLLRKSILNGLYIARTDAQIQEEERLEENEKMERKKNRLQAMNQDDILSK
jgi:DNA-binding CsgD family transcriptional regulator